MNKVEVVRSVLGERYLQLPQQSAATCFAPTNIALVKYWGKRQAEINLPITSSLSISLGNKGAETTLIPNDSAEDNITLNGQIVKADSVFAQRLVSFLNLFRNNQSSAFDVIIKANIPIAAGLASSACGFAALVKALNSVYGWKLSTTELSILARLGSGSASRSLWDGFVEWQMGIREDGMDSYGVLFEKQWPELQVGLLILDNKEKTLSSRVAMQRTVDTSLLYAMWPKKVNQDLVSVKKAIQQHDFKTLGEVAESNALTMHGLMLSAVPPISYALPETITQMQKIWRLRQEGLSVYFTQDAGPNLKLLFLKEDSAAVREWFPGVEIV